MSTLNGRIIDDSTRAPARVARAPAILGSARPRRGRAKPDIVTRKPRPADGGAIWELVKDTGVLDLNSSYSYLLLCRHFADTCVVADPATEEIEGVVGFVSGYHPPAKDDTLFIWQVAVSEEARGQGVAQEMVRDILYRDVCSDVAYIETTVTPSNEPSQALFESIARDLETDFTVRPCFPADVFPEDGHETENLYRIGPFSTGELRSAA